VEQYRLMRRRRGNEPGVRMPETMARNAWLVVMDEQGKLLRSELVLPQTNLPERLAAEAAAYAEQGWAGQPAPGQWTFIVRKEARRLAIGIRAARPSDAPS